VTFSRPLSLLVAIVQRLVHRSDVPNAIESFVKLFSLYVMRYVLAQSPLITVHANRQPTCAADEVAMATPTGPTDASSLPVVILQEVRNDRRNCSLL